MRIPRVYTAAGLAPGHNIELEPATARRLLRVLRLRHDDPLVLFNGDGQNYTGRLHVSARDRASARILEAVPNPCESPLHITLVQGISRGERMDYTLQKAVELGVNAIHPVLCERTVVRLDARRAEKRHRHWQGVIISACEQCGRSRLPELHMPQALQTAFQALPPGQRLMPAPGASEGLAGAVHEHAVVLLIGPEGGLGEQETRQAQAAGFRCIHLGPRILRTETAGVAAMAVLQALGGDLRAPGSA